MKSIRYSFLLVVSAVFCFLNMNTQAQELEVSPVSLSFATNPGSSQTQQIFLRNRTDKEQSYIFNLSDWLSDEDGEVTYFDPGTTGRSCAEWITVSPSLVTLQPNESTMINVTMLVPNDNSATKWAVLFVQSAVEQTGTKKIDKDVEMGMQISLRIAVPIYQSPASNTLYNGTIDELTQTIEENGQRTYESRVINLGDKILNCKVYFTVSNIATAEEFTSDAIEFSLLPESNKKVSFTFDKAFDKGKYSVAAILDYGYDDELEGIQMDVDVK